MTDDDLQREWAYARAAGYIAKATLRAILDYIPEGFISGDDDDDTAAYRRIARGGLARLEAEWDSYHADQLKGRDDV